MQTIVRDMARRMQRKQNQSRIKIVFQLWDILVVLCSSPPTPRTDAPNPPPRPPPGGPDGVRPKSCRLISCSLHPRNILSVDILPRKIAHCSTMNRPNSSRDRHEKGPHHQHLPIDSLPATILTTFSPHHREDPLTLKRMGAFCFHWPAGEMSLLASGRFLYFIDM